MMWRFKKRICKWLGITDHINHVANAAAEVQEEIRGDLEDLLSHLGLRIVELPNRRRQIAPKGKKAS